MVDRDDSRSARSTSRTLPYGILRLLTVLPCTAVCFGLRAPRRGERETPLGNGRHRPCERDKVSETSTDILTPLDVENEFRIPRSSQKKGRATGFFAPYFRVGRRVYYRRHVLEAWIADQERRGGDNGG